MEITKTTKTLLVATLFVTGATSLLILSKTENCATSQNTVIETDVLEPVLNDSQEVTFLKNYYSCHAVEREDIVQYKHSGLDRNMPRQVKALPGDTMAFDNCNIKINDEVLENSQGEKYCFEGKRKSLLQIYSGSIDGYLILTEETEGGFDSTRFGLVSKDSFEGKLVEKTKFLGII